MACAYSCGGDPSLLSPGNPPCRRAPALKMKDENTLPVCDSQDRPGRWVFQTSLYPEVCRLLSHWPDGSRTRFLPHHC